MLSRELTKNAENKPFDEVFKLPAKPSEQAKNEVQCEDFNILLAHWAIGRDSTGPKKREEKYDPKKKVSTADPAANTSPGPDQSHKQTSGASPPSMSASPSDSSSALPPGSKVPMGQLPIPRPSQTGKGPDAPMANQFWGQLRDKTTGAPVRPSPHLRRSPRSHPPKALPLASRRQR